MNIGGGPLGAMSSRIFDENTEGITGVKSGASRKGLKDSNIPVNHIGSFTRSIDSLIHSIAHSLLLTYSFIDASKSKWYNNTIV